MRLHTHLEATPLAVLRHKAFFDRLPDPLKPARLRFVPGAADYQYQWIVGHQPSSQDAVEEVYRAADRHLWQPTGSDIDADAIPHYLEYVRERAKVAEWAAELAEGPMFDNEAVRNAERVLLQCPPLRRVDNAHGDLTLENVLMTEAGPVFIDPGDLRGVPCREIDEGKLLQSLLCKWDVVNGTSGAFNLRPPFQVTPVALAFLATHLVRLCAHTDRHAPSKIASMLRCLSHVGQLLDAIP